VGSHAAGDEGRDPPDPQQAPVLVMVIAAVGDQPGRSPARSSHAPAHRRDGIDERDELGDVVAVSRRQRPGERDAAPVGEDVVLDACAPRSTGLGPTAEPPLACA
jgi:hypothetical protein